MQLQGLRVFLGINRHHPKTLLEMEMEMLPLEWAAKKRCVAFWVKLLQMISDRLIKVIAEDVLESVDKVKWMMDLRRTLKEIG